MAVCKWYLLNIRCFLSCVQIFEHFLNTLRPHFCVALCHLAVGAKIALKRGKKNCKPLFRDLHFLCELFRSRIIKFYVIWLKNVVFRLFAHSFRPRPPFNPIFSFSLKTHNLFLNRARKWRWICYKDVGRQQRQIFCFSIWRILLNYTGDALNFIGFYALNLFLKQNRLVPDVYLNTVGVKIHSYLIGWVGES